jgi:hypothetical protein
MNIHKYIKQLLMAPEGDGTGGGGSGGDPLFDKDKGGGAGSPPPDNKEGGTGGAPPPSVVIPENWKESLPAELREAPYMKDVKDVGTLAKNYANAQKMIGADKIPIPQKGASADEWKGVFQKLGLPPSVEAYQLELSKDLEGKVDGEFLTEFKKAAHEQGVLPSQATKLVEWFSKINESSFQKQTQEAQVKTQQELNGLKTTWGEAWDSNLAKARAALNEFCTPEEVKSIREMGLGSNATFLKLMSQVGSTLAEDKIRGEGGSSDVLTPEAAKSKITEIQSNFTGPYYDKNHAGHVEAVKMMETLFKQAYPGNKK